MLVLALMSTPCGATIVFVTLTRDAIYVGADGRGTIIDEADNETYTDICKIRQFRKVVVAYSGTVSDPTANFDVWDILSRINAGSAAEFADKVAKVLTDRLQALKEQKERTGKSTQHPFIPGDVGIMSFEGGKPAYVRMLFLNENGTIRAIKKDDGSAFARDLKINPGTIASTPIGKFDAISFSDLASLDCPDGVEVEQRMRCQLKAYINADPKHINEPISIAKITEAGVSWIVKGKCGSTTD